MRILLTLSRIERAGFTTFCENLTTGLSAAQHEVLLLSGSTLDTPAYKYAVPSSYAKSFYINRGLSSSKAQIRNYIRVVNDIAPDAMIINYSPFVMAALPFISWPIIRIPVVHNTLDSEVKASLANHFWWDRAICVSPLIAKVASGLPGSTKLHVCPLGIPIGDTGKKSPRNFRCGGNISIVWVGRVEKLQKRADLIPLIARELEAENMSYRWTILGEGTELRSITNVISEMGISDKFRFMGSVPHAQIDDFFAQSDILVMPSDHEGLPQALLEAMSAGVVPIVSRIPGATDYVVRDGEEGFLCDRGKPESFATRIVELAKNPVLLAQMSENSVKRISGEFNVDAFAKRVLGHIEGVHREGILRTTPRPVKYLTHKYASEQRCDGMFRAAAKQAAKWLMHSCFKRHI